jgi:DnaJ-class molecular chaperone
MSLLSVVDVSLNLKKYSLMECPHCSGYGSSLKEAADRCTQCGGTGLVLSKKLEIFLASDQPEECRKCGCGARTDFIDLKPGTQLHRCPECGYTYLVVEE